MDGDAASTGGTTSNSGSGSGPMDVDLTMLQASLNAMMKQGVNNNSGREGGIVCWNCDQVGHYSRHFPQPKRVRKAGN